jgi:hypothetical protein
VKMQFGLVLTDSESRSEFFKSVKDDRDVIAETAVYDFTNAEAAEVVDSYQNALAVICRAGHQIDEGICGGTVSSRQVGLAV